MAPSAHYFIATGELLAQSGMKLEWPFFIPVTPNHIVKAANSRKITTVITSPQTIFHEPNGGFFGCGLSYSSLCTYSFHILYLLF